MVHSILKKGEPGTINLGFKDALAGLDGRSGGLGFTVLLATVSVMGEPGNAGLGFRPLLAGLDGRRRWLGFKAPLATVFEFMAHHRGAAARAVQ